MNSWLAAFISALCFALMSLFIKLSLNAGVSAIDLTFYRFAFGSLCLGAFLILRKQKLNIVSWKFTLLRAFTNIIAVSLFYLSFQYLDLGTANLLNLTYPIFIIILAPIFLKETFTMRKVLAVLLSSIGIGILFLDTANITYQFGLLIGLICGFVSALTIMTLRQARKFDSSVMIVSVLMTIGCIFTLPFYSFEFPSVWYWVLLASIFALMGQIFITYSFGKLNSVQGSIMSSSRIIISYLLGIIFLSDILRWEFVVASLFVCLSIYLAKKSS